MSWHLRLFPGGAHATLHAVVALGDILIPSLLLERQPDQQHPQRLRDRALARRRREVSSKRHNRFANLGFASTAGHAIDGYNDGIG